jgi:hypothetical protein
MASFLTVCPMMCYNRGMKRETHFRLTEQARTLLAHLAEAGGISQNAVMELLIREAARKRGIRADSGVQGSPQQAPAAEH